MKIQLSTTNASKTSGRTATKTTIAKIDEFGRFALFMVVSYKTTGYARALSTAEFVAGNLVNHISGKSCKELADLFRKGADSTPVFYDFLAAAVKGDPDNLKLRLTNLTVALAVTDSVTDQAFCMSFSDGEVTVLTGDGHKKITSWHSEIVKLPAGMESFIKVSNGKTSENNEYFECIDIRVTY